MGSVFKRGDKWYAEFKVPGNGWVRRCTGARFKQSAEQILSRWEDEVAKGNIGIFEIQPIKFSAFCPKYLEWANTKKRPNTLRLERGIIGNHLKPFFGQTVLDRIQAADIDRYIANRKSNGVKARTINLETLLLSVILKRAVKGKHLARLPFEKIADFKLKETDSIKRLALNQSELSRLLASASGHNRLFIALLAYTGVRLSEAMFLSWDDIDLEREQIMIRPKPEHGFNTKSGKSRIIPLHPDLKEILDQEEKKVGWLFRNVKGERITTLRFGFYRACQKAGLKGISAHCLRHSFASLMIANGADAKTLSEILGHATPVITLTVYAHSFDSYRRQAINRLPSLEPEAGELVKFPGQKTG